MDELEACISDNPAPCENNEGNIHSGDQEINIRILSIPSRIEDHFNSLRTRFIDDSNARIQNLKSSNGVLKDLIEEARIESYKATNIDAIRRSLDESRQKINSLTIETQALGTLTKSDMEYCKAWPTERDRIQAEILDAKSAIREQTERLSKQEVISAMKTRKIKIKDGGPSDIATEYKKRLDEIRSERQRVDTEIRHFRKDDELVEKISIVHKCRGWINGSKILKPDQKKMILAKLAQEISQRPCGPPGFIQPTELV